jgi:hypothetical protein
MANPPKAAAIAVKAKREEVDRTRPMLKVRMEAPVTIAAQRVIHAAG